MLALTDYINSQLFFNRCSPVIVHLKTRIKPICCNLLLVLLLYPIYLPLALVKPKANIYAEYSPEPNLNTCRATIGTTGLIIKSYSMVIKHNVW